MVEVACPQRLSDVLAGQGSETNVVKEIMRHYRKRSRYKRSAVMLGTLHYLMRK